MKRPLSTLILVISWFAFSIFWILVDSKTPHGASPSPSPHYRSPRSSPRPQPPPSPPPAPPLVVWPRPPRLSPTQRPRGHPPPPLPEPRTNIKNKQVSKIGLNMGETVGLFFVGIAAFLQICVVGFLVFKRRQLLRSKDRYDGLS